LETPEAIPEATDRIITVVLRIKKPEEASAIWDRHMDFKLLNGCIVQAIGNDDVFKELEKVEDKLYIAEEILENELLIEQYEERTKTGE